MAADFRDRTRRLTVFGILALLAGALSIALGLAHLLLPVVGEALAPGSTASIDRLDLIAGLLLYVILGAVLVATGRGSLRLRRWVRPVMLTVAWTWLLSGLFGTVLVLGLVDDLIVLATADMQQSPSPELRATIKLVTLLAAGLLGVVLPAAFVWAYHDRDVGRTCEARHPEPAWTDRCPLPVLGLSLGLAFAALVSLPLALRPAVPFFGQLLGGTAGALVVALGAVFSLGLAWSIYRLHPSGWWATLLLLLVLGGSTAMTFARLDPVELYRALGYPEEQLAALGRGSAASRAVTVWTTVAVTLLSVAYMLAIRRHFIRRPD